jgi:hypothetical protein
MQKYQKTFQCRTCHADNAFYGVVPNLAVCAALEVMRKVPVVGVVVPEQPPASNDSKNEDSSSTSVAAKQSDPDSKVGSSLIHVGQIIHCYWPYNKTFYPGKITKVHHKKQQVQHEKGENTYDVSAQDKPPPFFGHLLGYEHLQILIQTTIHESFLSGAIR